MVPRKETPAERNHLVGNRWIHGGGTADEYHHFRKSAPPGYRNQTKGTLRLTLVLTEKGWQWGVDKPGWTGVRCPDAFEDPIACLLAAELAGWEL